jgi:nitroreductase
MDFDELVNKRFSIRNFQQKKVPQDLIEKIFSIANLAPSAKNRQPYNVYVINDDTLINE